MLAKNVLIIDDEEPLRKALARLLKLENYKVWETSTLHKGIDILRSEDIQIIILDVRLPDGNGIDYLSQIKSEFPNLEIIILTAYGSIGDGVRAIKEGAFDYITKGDEDNKIAPVVERALEKVQLKMRIDHLENQLLKKYGFENLIGQSDNLLRAVTMAKKAAETDVPVLLMGETGTGKEIFAQAIHYSGKRCENPFLALNCSAFAHNLLESEMFGYKAGAFTGASKNKKGLFEEADGGTLFLDEIGELEQNLQSKLLRALETGTFIKAGDTKPTEVDVRIIAASNRNLELEMEKGHFREDLYYRIAVMVIDIPPLRLRKTDIPMLADYFLKHYNQKFNKNIDGIKSDFLKQLIEYDYPGNIRELKNIIERAVILCNTKILGEVPLPFVFSARKSVESDNVPASSLSLSELEKQHIKDVLEACNGNRTRAAKILGISPATLYRKLASL